MIVIKQSPVFNIPDEIDAPLWRYISVEKFESLLKEAALYFSRSDLLGDEHEGSTTKPTIEYRKTFYEGASEDVISKGMPQLARDWGRCTFVSCWHNANNESIAMWELYLPKGDGVAIKTSLSRLKQYILDTEREFYLNPVHYLDFDNDSASEANAFIPFFLKRDIYQHEREVRILTATLDDLPAVAAGGMEPQNGLLIPIDIKMFIEKIVISPKANLKDQDKVNHLIDEYDLSDKVAPSILVRSPEF